MRGRLAGADLEHGIPVAEASCFHVASTSKQFTASGILLLSKAGILLLSKAGKLDLDADVRTYLPELAIAARQKYLNFAPGNSGSLLRR